MWDWDVQTRNSENFKVVFLTFANSSGSLFASSFGSIFKIFLASSTRMRPDKQRVSDGQSHSKKKDERKCQSEWWMKARAYPLRFTLTKDNFLLFTHVSTQMLMFRWQRRLTQPSQPWQLKEENEEKEWSKMKSRQFLVEIAKRSARSPPHKQPGTLISWWSYLLLRRRLVGMLW